MVVQNLIAHQVLCHCEVAYMCMNIHTHAHFRVSSFIVIHISFCNACHVMWVVLQPGLNIKSKCFHRGGFYRSRQGVVWWVGTSVLENLLCPSSQTSNTVVTQPSIQQHETCPSTSYLISSHGPPSFRTSILSPWPYTTLLLFPCIFLWVAHSRYSLGFTYLFIPSSNTPLFCSKVFISMFSDATLRWHIPVVL